MNVYAVDKYPRPSEYAKEVWGMDKLDDLLAMSDWLVVTAPITDETRGLIDEAKLGLMKQGAHVIVISRGGIVDEYALAEAIESGHLGGAGVDAMEPEPPALDNPLWENRNVIISPHASAFTRGLFVGRRDVFKENFRRYLAGEPFLYVCDKKLGY
jgi:phosphoglycerate dehydrogenase-like enzyme